MQNCQCKDFPKLANLIRLRLPWWLILTVPTVFSFQRSVLVVVAAVLLSALLLTLIDFLSQ